MDRDLFVKFLRKQLVQVFLTSLIYVEDNIQSVGHYYKINPNKKIIPLFCSATIGQETLHLVQIIL